MQSNLNPHYNIQGFGVTIELYNKKKKSSEKG